MATSLPLAPSPAPATNPRLASIDAYRGFVMFLMMADVLRLSAVAAKFPSSEFWKFLAHHQSHVPWAGCSLHDLIQPSFSFLVGVALPFSIASRMAKGQSRGVMLLHAIWRAIILVLLGVFLRSMSAKQTNWTFEDTLSQIGFGYVPLFLLGLTRQRWHWVALVTILVGYWGAFLAYSPPEDFDVQKYGVPADWPYHYSGIASDWNKNSNLAWAFDTWFLNLFPRPKPFLFNGGGYATLSFIPTLATMILGLIAGRWLQNSLSPGERVAEGRVRAHKPEAQARGSAAVPRTTPIQSQLSPSQQTIGALLLTGVILLFLGLVAHGTVQIPYVNGWENLSFLPESICPCVKRIWTPSWTLYSGGWCFLLLAAFYTVIDVGRISSWSFPLRVIGANSIAAYILAHGPDRFIRDSLQIHFGQNIYAIFGDDYKTLVAGAIILAIEWLILYWLYRQKIHIRI